MHNQQRNQAPISRALFLATMHSGPHHPQDRGQDAGYPEKSTGMGTYREEEEKEILLPLTFIRLLVDIRLCRR